MADRTLKDVRIRVEGVLVQLYDPETGIGIAALHDYHGEVCPDLRSVVGEDGKSQCWLMVTGSKFGGLPLLGDEKSWERAWDDAQIEFLLPSAKGWHPVDDWQQILNVILRK